MNEQTSKKIKRNNFDDSETVLGHFERLKSESGGNESNQENQNTDSDLDIKKHRQRQQWSWQWILPILFFLGYLAFIAWNDGRTLAGYFEGVWQVMRLGLGVLIGLMVWALAKSFEDWRKGKNDEKR